MLRIRNTLFTMVTTSHIYLQGQFIASWSLQYWLILTFRTTELKWHLLENYYITLINNYTFIVQIQPSWCLMELFWLITFELTSTNYLKVESQRNNKRSREGSPKRLIEYHITLHVNSRSCMFISVSKVTFFFFFFFFFNFLTNLSPLYSNWFTINTSI